MISSTIPAAILTLAAITGQPRGEVLDFTATWCGPCQQMSPIVKRLEHAGYPIRKVDVDSNRPLAEKFGISSIPAFVLVVDGREVTRVVGAVSEQQLLSMLSQIPTDPPVMTVANDNLPRSQNTDQAPSRNWDPVASSAWAEETPPPTSQLTQPVVAVIEETPRTPARSAAGEEEKSSPSLLGRIFGRGGKQQPASETPDVVRANIETQAAEPANVLPIRDPVKASVRLHVTINGQTQLGSGTAIDSRPGQTVITTCGHLFDGWNDRSKIEVNLFLDGKTQPFVGRMIHYDMAADVGIIGIPTDGIIPTAEIAAAASRPQVQDALVSIGCSGGADPTHEQVQVTALNYYEGPDNIECTGVPVQGRSGGGLFNLQGQLVGLCIAADAERQRGAYAGLLAIHDLLAKNGMSDIYQPVAQTPPVTDAAPNQSPAASPAPVAVAVAAEQTLPVTQSPDMSPPSPSASHADPAAEFDPFASVAASADADTEVICILRSKQQPGAPSRVVIIDRPSSKFLSYLDGEIAARETSVPAPAAHESTTHERAVRGNAFRATSAPAASSPSTRYPAATPPPATSSRFSIPADDNADPALFAPGEHSRSASLQPTALARPFHPQQYLRSPHTR